MLTYPEGVLLLEIGDKGPTYPQSKLHMRLLLRRFQFQEIRPDVFRMRSIDGVYRAQAHRYSLIRGWVSLHTVQGHIDLNSVSCPYEKGDRGDNNGKSN